MIVEIALPAVGASFAQIAAGDLDVAVIGQLPAAELALNDKLEPGPLEVKRLHAPLGCRRPVEEMLKDAARDPHCPLVFAEDDTELDGIAVGVPAGILREAEEHFYHCDLCQATAEVRRWMDILLRYGRNRTQRGVSDRMRISAITTAAIAITLGVLRPQPALCWGDEGHEIVVLVAQAFLEPGVRSKVIGLLATDTDSLIPHDLASEATWADKYRDANRNGSRENTRRWHFVDIEISHSDLDGACFGHRPIPTGTVASNGPARDCLVDKVEEFAAELSNPATDPEERIVALKFLLHLVGDLHQPLHASDDNDRGGNDKPVVTPGLKAGNLHHFWDTEFVDRLGTNSRSIASDLIGHISKAQQQDWSQGTPADWAWESFQMVRQDAYGQLPAPSAHRSYLLTDDYVSMATRDVVVQLSKAGVPLAFLLNKALGRPPAKSELGLSPRQVFSCPR